MAETSFAERFAWARARSGLGATGISRTIGCAQSLISQIETNADRHSSKYTDEFAELFKVDANWLRTGKGPAPKGFDAVRAKEIIAQRTGAAESESGSDMGLPRWAEATPKTEAERADELQQSILSQFQDYARIVGAERTKAFMQVLSHFGTLLADSEKPEGDSKKRPAD